MWTILTQLQSRLCLLLRDSGKCVVTIHLSNRKSTIQSGNVPILWGELCNETQIEIFYFTYHHHSLADVEGHLRAPVPNNNSTVAWLWWDWKISEQISGAWFHNQMQIFMLTCHTVMCWFSILANNKLSYFQYLRNFPTLWWWRAETFTMSQNHPPFQQPRKMIRLAF